MTVQALLLGLAIIVGLALCWVGAWASYIAARVNMSWNNPLPRVGFGFLFSGVGLLAVGIWGFIQ